MNENESFQLFPEEEFDAQLLPDSKISENIIAWLLRLYELTDWRCLLFDESYDYYYNGISILCFFKAYALPYLINLKISERELNQLIIKRVNIQRLCGFKAGDPLNYPSNFNNSEQIIGDRTFWHFRDKYKNVFSELMIKSLILLVLSGKNGNLNLPFVEEINKDQFNDDDNIITWLVDDFRSPITFSIPLSENDLSSQRKNNEFERWQSNWKQRFIQCNSLKEYRNLEKKYRDEIKIKFRKEKSISIDGINFPIDVEVELSSGKLLTFRLIHPVFTQESKRFNNFSPLKYIPKDTKSVNYDKACNILVIREINGEKEILLSRRIKNGVIGPYAVPGGKQNENETLEECSKRELKEETGLILLESKPVSIYYTMHKGKQVMSLGVLALKWDGFPQTIEPNNHEGWEWHKFSNLPEDLFEYSRIAIDQYNENTYQNLMWEDFEEKPESHYQAPLIQ